MVEKTSGIIYCAVMVDGRRYYGQTTRTLKVRKSEHEKAALTGKRCAYFHNALRKYGLKNFAWFVVETCDEEVLGEREAFYIQSDNTIEEKYGFNLCLGGDVPRRYRLTDEHKKKIGDAQRGKPKPKHSLETRKKMSEAHKNRQFSEQHIESIRKTQAMLADRQRGQKRGPLSLETREKIRQAALNQWERQRGGK